MYNNRSDDYRRSNKQKLAIRPRATDFLAGMKKNEARRRSFAVAISNESTLNLPRGGTSKSAKSKHQKVLGSVAMGSIHALFQEQDATTPQKLEHSKQVVAYFQKQVEEQESRIRSKKRQTDTAVSEVEAVQNPSLPRAPSSDELQAQQESNPSNFLMHETLEIISEDEVVLNPLLPRTPLSDRSQRIITDNGTVVAKRKRLQDQPALSESSCPASVELNTLEIIAEDEVVLNPLLPRTPLSDRSQRIITDNGTVVAKRKRLQDQPALSGSPCPASVEQNTHISKSPRTASPGPITNGIINSRSITSVKLAGKKQRKLTTTNTKRKAAECALGPILLDLLKKLQTPRARRPYLAALVSSKHKRVAVEAAIGHKIHANEWTNIKIHERFPGPMKPVQREQISRMRVPKAALMALLQYLDSPGTTQRYAFGTKVLSIGRESKTVEIDNVSFCRKLEDAVADYLRIVFWEIEVELNELQDLPDEEDRCQHKENGKHARRCMQMKDHDGKCRFTPKGSISRTTARELAKMLTGPEIKKLAGLDDCKVLKGRNNWIRARKISDTVFDGNAAEEYKERVDSQEEFYSTDFIPHLSKISNHKCNCLTCGFCDKSKCQNMKRQDTNSCKYLTTFL
jgi:hypothetical protein